MQVFIHNLRTGHRFNFSSAPRPVGEGMKKYGRVIGLAEHLGLSLQEAEKYGDMRLFSKGLKLAAVLQ